MACLNADLFRGAGELMIADYVDTFADETKYNFRLLGNTPLFTISTTQDFEEVRESKSGKQQLLARSLTSTDTEVDFEMNSFSKENLAVAFYGTTTDIAGGSVLNETLTLNELNKPIPVARVNLTSGTVVVNEVGQPALTEGTDYTVNLTAGSITFISSANIVGSLPGVSIEVDYDFGANEEINSFQAPIKEYAIYFEGINALDNDKAVRVFVPRVQINTAETMALISTAPVILAVNGRALVDCFDNTFKIIKEV